MKAMERGTREAARGGFRAFTLVELLTVIGVIAVLAGLLLPMLKTAKESARKAYCVNNLKQIGIGLTSYSDSFDGAAPPFSYSSSHLAHADFAFIDGAWDGLGTAWRNGFIGSAKIFYCPSDRMAFYSAEKGGYNGAPASGTRVETSYIYRSPDIAFWDGRVGWESARWHSAGCAVVSDAFGSMEHCGNHRNGLNVLYGDGRVEWRRVLDISQVQVVENKATRDACCNETMSRGWLPLDNL